MTLSKKLAEMLTEKIDKLKKQLIIYYFSHF